MKMQAVKLSLLSLVGIFVLCFGWTGRLVQADLNGPPTARTGAPNELTCATTECHRSNSLNAGAGILSLTGLPSNYTTGQDVPLTVMLTLTGRSRFGFQVVALDDQGRQAGMLTATDPSRTFRLSGVVNGALRHYLENTQSGAIPVRAGQNSWTFRWTPPSQNRGRVTFYVAGVAADGDGSALNDFNYTKSFSVQPAAIPQAVATVSAASYFQDALAGDAIAALFGGGGLADSTAVATTIPLPTTLGNVTTRIKDATGTEREAPLFFVSGAQINLLIPAGTSSGSATITVLKDGTPVGTGTLNIETVAPGLFTADASGQGTPAALLFRLKASGEQSLEAIPAQIDLGSAGERVFLVAFGTGFRNRSSLNAVTCIIGGENAPVLFAGAQGFFVGLDQANIEIPRTLIGRGLVNVALTVEGKNANVVRLNIK